jgi:hypothetical protein
VHDLGTIKAHQNDYQWLSSQNLLERCSPYAQLDDTRTSAFSPSPKASFPAISPAGGMMAFPSRLPNPTVHFDLRTLNLHLALRTADTLACAEAMWEWVADYQASQAALERERNRGSVDGRGPGRRSQSPMMWRAIKVLTRAEFDELLTKFDL